MTFSLQPITAKNGQQVQVRFLTPDDGDLLVNLVVRLSCETRYRRFHISMDDVPMDEIRRRLPPFLDVDGIDSVALLALVDEPRGQRAIAVARFRRQPGATEAEAAVVVRDDWHRLGIGSQLMRQLVGVARELGITRFTAMIQAGNRGVHDMIRNLDIDYVSHIEHGEDYIVMNLEDPAS